MRKNRISKWIWIGAGGIFAIILFLGFCHINIVRTTNELVKKTEEIQMNNDILVEQINELKNSSVSDDDEVVPYVDSSEIKEEESEEGETLEQESFQELISSVSAEYLRECESIGEEWAISIQDLTNNVAADINGDVKMKSASILKVFIMAAVYDRVCYPRSFEESIYFEENFEGELKELISIMITESDNNAANSIVERLGEGDYARGASIVNEFCQRSGYLNTFMGRKFLGNNEEGDNFTSSNDCANILMAIYNGECVNEEASGKMLGYLKEQSNISKIPSGLIGYDVMTANKTGELSSAELGYVENDVAIVWNDEVEYVLCILSQNLTQGNQTAINRIVSISDYIYEQLTKSEEIRNGA